jgi:hypothetical protein
MDVDDDLIGEVITWLKWPANSRPEPPEGDADPSPEWALLTTVVTAVVDYIGQHYAEPVEDEDNPDGVGIASYRLGVVMQSGRLWKRRDTPEGVAGIGTDAPIHITKLDHDVEKLLSGSDPFTFA